LTFIRPAIEERYSNAVVFGLSIGNVDCRISNARFFDFSNSSKVKDTIE